MGPIGSDGYPHEVEFFVDAMQRGRLDLIAQTSVGLEGELAAIVEDLDTHYRFSFRVSEVEILNPPRSQRPLTSVSVDDSVNILSVNVHKEENVFIVVIDRDYHELKDELAEALRLEARRIGLKDYPLMSGFSCHFIKGINAE